MTGDELAEKLYAEQGYVILGSHDPHEIGDITYEGCPTPGTTLGKAPLRVVATASLQQLDHQAQLALRIVGVQHPEGFLPFRVCLSRRGGRLITNTKNTRNGRRTKQMITLKVNGTDYKIEFRHVTKLGKRAQLHRGSVKAVTVCVVTTDKWQAIDVALCADSDNFSRWQGRHCALLKLLEHCRALKDDAPPLLGKYLEIDPYPVRPPKVRPKLTAEQVAAIKAEAEKLPHIIRRRQRQGRP